ncbi:hypothetical protein PIB30_022660 [Stylosanthes scabra]|uniref:Leucine-rich repeat-containing N-terminal plant-type domain-containing protein n=1 Tax=Stylosanthes scabra TaxID=79078 RepID=A0ABU6V7J1_9FABA|nr:hypothetical protein [Stylosanthes scabra]
MEWALNRKKQWLVLVGTTLVLVQVLVNTSGCFREEKRSLLEFKSAYSNHSLLPSWVDDDDSDSNCCDWERVECDPSSGYVFNLSLSNIRELDAYGRCSSAHFNWSLLLTFTELTTLDLSHNCFQNFVCERGLCEMRQIEELYLNDNEFEGTLDPLMGNMTSLRTLDLSHNLLSGSIPASIAVMPSLRILNLGHNHFSGSIPVNMFDGRETSSSETLPHPTGLHILDLSHNKFSGHLPFSFTISPSLVFINLKGNNLTGKIPDYYPGGNNIVAIDFSDNKFTGTIPWSIYSLESLTFLLLAGNHLQDQLSHYICDLRNLQILDLSRNKFTGSIPSCLNNIAFRDVNFVFSHGKKASVSADGAKRYRTQIFGFKYRMGEVQVITKGSSRSYEGDTLKIMSALDLSSNQLTGEIPRELGELSSLHALNLSHNHLTGSIPESFCNLENIESMDLSYNSLSGEIPHDLQDLYYLAIFNVSYNNLSGIAPEGNQFGIFDDSNYEGNPFLHWTNSNRRIPPSPTPLEKGKKDDCFIDLASFYWTFSASYVTVLLALVTILWINPYWRSLWFYFVVRFLLKCFGHSLGDGFYKKIMK